MIILHELIFQLNYNFKRGKFLTAHKRDDFDFDSSFFIGILSVLRGKFPKFFKRGFQTSFHVLKEGLQ